MSARLEHVVVVGASLAGLRAAETLRSDGFEGAVTVIGAEPHRPYDRPPLSKKLLLGEWEPDRIALRREDAFDELDVIWTLGTAAASLDLHERRVHLADGSAVGFDGLVIATGSVCRRLPDQPDADSIHELRTLDDALRLRAELLPGGRRVVVVGGGFIGLEVAAAARLLGNDVTVVEALPAPLARVLGPEIGRAIGALHEAEGVDVRTGTTIESIGPGGVRLSDGTELDADVIVVGIGVTPATDWLAGGGLELRDGVVCEPTLAVRPADVDAGPVVPGVYAAGDVARWTNPLFDEEMRVEHWTNAAEQGAHAVRSLLAWSRGDDQEPYAPVPFFWSDQYHHRIQFLGSAAADDEVRVVAGSVHDGKFLALFGREGRIGGAFGLNAPRWVMAMRNTLLDRSPWEDAIAHATTATA